MAEQHIWSDEHIISSNVVDVYIRRLRRKIDDPFEEKLLETLPRGRLYHAQAINKDEKLFLAADHLLLQHSLQAGIVVYRHSGFGAAGIQRLYLCQSTAQHSRTDLSLGP